jgi:type II secretory pathway component PulF
MAAVVIFGLLVATFLTLVVVPALYYVFENAGRTFEKTRVWMQKAYWKPFPYLAGGRMPKSK